MVLFHIGLRGKVCYIAQNMPEADIVIIGEVTEHRDKLEKYKNIKLLGEMKYEDLPKHLAYFDVCLIPLILRLI